MFQGWVDRDKKGCSQWASASWDLVVLLVFTPGQYSSYQVKASPSFQFFFQMQHESSRSLSQTSRYMIATKGQALGTRLPHALWYPAQDSQACNSLARAMPRTKTAILGCVRSVCTLQLLWEYPVNTPSRRSTWCPCTLQKCVYVPVGEMSTTDECKYFLNFSITAEKSN